VFAFLLAVALIFFVGLRLGGRGQTAAAAPTTSQQPATFQQPGISVQPGIQAQPVAPGQQPPFDQPAVRQARFPAGDEVPIGDNPRLALPELAKTNYVHDFGDVPPDEIQETTVTIQNKGTQPLLIKSVRASCGCTAANTGEDTVPPGETTDLRVTYDPTYHNDAGVEVTRQVIIETNDPAAPVVEFTLRANVLNQ
ncbi:MAG: DUF1573 domain-containing protein, partial [Anaerolineae bacterium]